MSKTLPDSLEELFPQLISMTETDKIMKLARHLSCDNCDCDGWRSMNDFIQDTTCLCGHDADCHVDKKRDFMRRLKVALRLEELLDEKGKLDDYDYIDQDIQSLKKQIRYNAVREPSTDNFLSDASSPSSMDDDERSNKRSRDSSDDEENSKRFKSDNEEDGLSDEEVSDYEDYPYNMQNNAEKSVTKIPKKTFPQHQQETDDEEKEEEEEEEEEEEGDEEEEEEEEEDYEAALELQKEKELLNKEIPKIKSQTADGERLLNEEALKVNGAMNAKEGILDIDGKMKVLEDFKPLERKETAAMIEERTGIIEVRVVENDGKRDSMILLTGLKNIFQKQLPKMPKEYIARLVYDRNHKSIALIRKPMKVIGGICFRPFDPQEFAEIVFCAIASTEQVKGYGSFLMNHLKDYVSGHTNMKHYLTYADNYATGYFKKQGFTTEITLDKRKWVGYIKDYEGGTIMQCTTVPKVKYLNGQEILAIQKNAVYEKMKQYSTSHIVYPGIKMPLNENGRRCIDPYRVPGVKESGWTPEVDTLAMKSSHPPHYNQMRHLVSELRANAHSWPFHEPVNAEEVVDYYEVITEPMDLTTLEENVENDKYNTLGVFIADVQKIFDNCRVYNAEGTNYARCANRLERYFKERLRVWTNGDD